MKLLTRDEFRLKSLERDNYKCIICNNPAIDVHHILERRLFNDGGYYLENSASLCSKHHIEAEQTILSCEEIREKIGIKHICLPEHLYKDNKYDKWGNIILPTGVRLKGELMEDESVIKILKSANILKCFSPHVKYPRTYHLPWSESVRDDDRVLKDLSNFKGKEIVVTEKMDGENTTIYKDYIHARSLDSQNHPSRNWIKNAAARFQYDIPDEWRICGENLYAVHSIKYSDLGGYFYMFSIWDNKNICLSWDETLEYSCLFDISVVNVLYRGIYDEKLVKNLNKSLDLSKSEGYVMRLSSSFSYGNFRKSVAKFVRKNHIQTEKHWFFGQKMEINELKYE